MNQMRIYLLQTEKFLSYYMPPVELAEYEADRDHYQLLAERKRQEKTVERKKHISRGLWKVIVETVFQRFQNEHKKNELAETQAINAEASSPIERREEVDFDFMKYCHAQQLKQVRLFDWLQHEVERLRSEPDNKMHSAVESLVMECILEKDEAGLYWLLDFPGASYLNMQLIDLHPLLPHSYHSRVRRIIGNVLGNDEVDSLFGKETDSLPPEGTTPFAVLNEVIPKWTFFTKQEIREIQPVVLDYISRVEHDFGYEQEWKELLTAHEKYDYDWLAFYYMF